MKKRMSKRFLSLLLVMVMVLSALPMAAMAAEFKSFDVQGVDVNVGFGAEFNPNNALTGYDIKAVGAVIMNYDSVNKKMVASGETELYVPYSMFKDTIDDTIEDKLSTALGDVINPALQEYNSKVTEYLGKPIHYVDTVSAELYPDPADDDYYIEVDVDIDIAASNLAELLEIIRSGKQAVEYGGVVVREFYYYEIFETVEKALRAVVDYAVENELGLTPLSYTDATPEGRAYKNWVAGVKDPSSDVVALAEILVASLGLKYAQEEYGNDAVKLLLKSIPLYTGSEPDEMFKGRDQIALELETEIKEDVIGMTDGYVADLLTDIQTGFYGPLAAGETLTDRFDKLEVIVNDFIADVSADFADYDVTGISSVDLPLPTEQIGSVEGMLKTIVAKMNNVNANSVEIAGSVIGGDAVNDQLADRSDIGMYVVAGVKSSDTSDMKYEAYVIAPDVVPVTIKSNGTDMGYFMHKTVGEAYEITSSVASGYDADNLMALRITGVETDGGIYDSAEEPTNAGVYTVFSFYFDKTTMAMGGDIAVLVIEPKDTPTDEFKFTEDKTVPYNGEGQFPAITNPNNHMSVSIAADRNKADVYVMLPENFGDTVGAYTDRAEDILERLETEVGNVGLPLPDQITAKILGALTALDNYANAAEGPAKVTNKEIKDRLNNYLTAVKDLYTSGKLVEKAGNVVDDVKEVLKTNPTIQGYKDMIKNTLDEFKAFKDSTQNVSTFALRRAAMSDEERIAREFLNRFMDQADVNEDDVRALLSYVADYADNSSYKQDAITLIKTLGVIGKVETDKVRTAVDNVDAAFDALKADVKAKLIEINGRADSVPTKADAVEVLGYVEDFVQSVEEQAKEVVKAFTVQNIYFGVKPSAVGVYDCYAINVSANYVPNLTTATLEITHVHTSGAPVIENVVAADCVNEGSYDTVVYCAECNQELSRVTTVVPALGHSAAAAVIENYQAATATAPESWDEVVYCSVCGIELSREHVIVPGAFVCMNVQTDVYYTDLSDALAAVNDPAAETIRMLKDYTETYVIIAPGTTLDLADYTVTASFVVGMNGSKLTATPNSGKLVAPKANLTLAKDGYKNADDQYILPIWDPAANCYQFTQFVLNTDNANRGLYIDEANDEIYFQFKHQATGAINQSLLSDGASDNALKVIVRLVWDTTTGSAHQDFFYNDTLVAQVTGAYDYNFKLVGYSAMDIQLDTLKVTAMTITDSGMVACGETWTAAMDKDNG